MDTIIIKEVAKAKRNKVVIYSIAVILFIIGSVLFIQRVFGNSVKAEEITLAVVENGTIENTINASGQILPEFEQIISSPITASIQQVFVDGGARVKRGEAVLLLDKTTTQSEYEKLKFGLESKRNEIQKLKLELDKSFSDLTSNNNIKQLRINSLMASLDDAKRLYKAGGGTREDIEKADLNLQVARLEKVQLENEIQNKQKSMRIEMNESQIAYNIQENDLKELKRKLESAKIAAMREGVVTYINKNIGANIREGEVLVRISDLASYKVSGSVSDSYLDILHKGMTAIVRINETQFKGSISNINPSVQNGLITFDVQLDDKNNKLFRPNMKVDIFLVTEVHNNVLRVANGPAFKGGLTQQIFVLNGKKALKRLVHIGLTNFDYVEIKDNVIVGDRIITSDMSNYINVKEINIK